MFRVRSLLRRGVRAVAVGAACAPLAGCAVLFDTLNPDLFTSFGLDPDALLGPPGRIVIAVVNDTDLPLEANIGVSNQANPTFTEGSLFARVPPNEVSNAVEDCPVTLIVPGEIVGEGGGEADPAITIITAEGEMNVEYTGAPLTAQDFKCGDVIEIRVQQTGDAEFEIRVTVIPS